ncbi:MAG: DUF4136 domain-containing protein [Bryobacteraceae bacterium]|jgi:hypothetical protein
MKIFFLLLAAALAASAQKVTIEFDQAANFVNYRTFAIRDGKLNSRNPALNSELVQKRIDADIERGLTARGLAMVSGKSDLNVRYRLGSARKAELESYPAGWRGFGTRIVRVPYTEGTLVIDLRDPTTRSLVWRAIASVEKSDATKLEGKLDDMVRKSLEKYPPKQK